MNTFFKKTFSTIKAHKIWTGIILIILICIGYAVYHYTRPAGAPQYTIARAHMGNIVQTVTGTGQVAATNQLSVTSQVSGTIESVNVSVGQHVSQGDLIATIDPTNALNSLNNAKISYAKLTETPKATDLSNAENSVAQSYGSAFNSISSLFLDMQTIMPGLNSLLYGQGTFLSDQEATQLTPTGQNYRNTAGMDYDKTNISYQTLLSEYAALSRQSSTSTISNDLADAYALAKNVANTMADTQNAITFVTTSQPGYLAKDVATTQNNVAAWSNSINNDVSSLLSAQTGITSSQNSLTNLVVGPDVNDVQSSQLSLQEAEQTYANYFIRAPFSGTIGLLPANVYAQASGGTAIATVIGDQKIATLTLDEVDAASVKVGDPVSLTFNAINNFTATGTVEEIDQVGTVVSGVVSYGVKVTINTADSRINPGMSVNATITTNEIDNVLMVPSAAVKSQGNANYVQTFDPTVVSQYMATLAAANGIIASSTARAGRSFASTTSQYSGSASSTYAGGYSSGTTGTGSTTRQYGNSNGGGTSGGRSQSVTMSSATAPTNQVITIGVTDGTNTQVLTGLSSGAWVVTKTVAASAAVTTTAAPSLLSSLGAGGRGGGGFGGAGGGAARTAGAGGATAAPTAARPAGN
jgi:multidrug efflux pump subunit AcrA (membrane-fusion protein)